MRGEDDVVIPDGIGQEVTGVVRAESQDYLRTAEIILILIAQELSFRHEMPFHIS